MFFRRSTMFMRMSQHIRSSKLSSTSSGEVSNKPKSLVEKTGAFVSKNRQQLLNIFAMYLVVSFGIHNFKVQKAWEEHEVEMKKLKDEYVALKESVLETTWLDEVEKKIRSSKPGQNILSSELESKFSCLNVENKPVEGDVPAEKSPAISRQVGKDPVGVVVNSKDSGKVI